jgi:CHAT domain-containing protein
MRPFARTCAFVAAALALPASLVGCGDGQQADRIVLDNTLTRAEQLISGGRDLEARQYLITHLAAHPEIWTGPSAPDGFRMLGDLSRSAAFFDGAIAFYQRAGAEYRARARRDAAYQMEYAEAELERQEQRPDRAHTLYTEALRLATVFGDSDAVRAIRLALLPVYRALEMIDDERKTATLLLAEAQRRKDPRTEARVFYELGLTRASLGEADRARDEFLRAVTLAEEVKDSVLAARALLRVAMSLDAAGRTRDVAETYGAILQRSGVLAAAPDLGLELLMRAGNFNLRKGNPGAAERLYRSGAVSARAAQNLLAEAYCGIQLGHCALARSKDQAIRQFRASFEQLRMLGHSRGIAYSLLSLGGIAERGNLLTDAAELYRRAVREQETCFGIREPGDLLAECERAALGPQGNDAHATLITLLLQIGRTDEAFWYQERKTGRLMFDTYALWLPRSGDRALDSLLSAFAHARALHIGAEKQLEILASTRPAATPLLKQMHQSLNASSLAMREIAERVVRKRPALEPAVRYDGIDAAALQQRLPEKTVVLTYILTRRSVYVAAISNARVSFAVSAAGSEQVSRLVVDFLAALAAPGVSADPPVRAQQRENPDLARATRGLYEALVLPVESALQSATSVRVVLPPGLPLFPFQALRRGGGGSPYLAERALVSYLPTVRAALLPSDPPGAVQDILCVGFPGKTSWDVEYELRDVRAFYKNARLCLGRSAVADTLRKRGADVLHLAVEIQLSRQRPVFGGVLLSDGQSSTGITRLPLGELFALPGRRAVLVSNLAMHMPILERSIPYALRSTGSGVVILNVFPATRKAKKDFGEAFYTALQGGASVSAAYRKTQQEMIGRKETEAPAMWAAFLLWN